MLFIFRGHHGPAVRALVGVLLVVIGIAVPGGALLAGVGVVLVVWGGTGALRAQRAGRHSQLSNGGRML
jgi:uncharacterized membrane protein (Fun14 family)